MDTNSSLVIGGGLVSRGKRGSCVKHACFLRLGFGAQPLEFAERDGAFVTGPLVLEHLRNSIGQFSSQRRVLICDGDFDGLRIAAPLHL